MININVKYTTRSGRQVEIYTTASPAAGSPVVGAYLEDGAWKVASWLEDGSFRDDKAESENDLVPWVQPPPSPVRRWNWIKEGFPGEAPAWPSYWHEVPGYYTEEEFHEKFGVLGAKIPGSEIECPASIFF